LYLRVSIPVVSFKWLDCDLILWLICPKSVLFVVKLCLILNVLSVVTGGLLKVRLSMLVVVSAIQNLNGLKLLGIMTHLVSGRVWGAISPKVRGVRET